MHSVVVLISGRGSNLRALIECSQLPGAAYRVVLVVADKPGAGGLRVAQDFGIAARSLPAPAGIDRSSYDRMLAAAIDEYQPSLIALAGFMRILSPGFVARYAGQILNIHPSLLPKYPGLATHRKVLAAHEAEHGATVHFVTPTLDGGPPILQSRVAVRPDDDESTLAARVLEQEHAIYPLAVSWYCTGRLRCHEGRAWLDGSALTTPVAYQGEALHIPA